MALTAQISMGTTALKVEGWKEWMNEGEQEMDGKRSDGN